MEIEDAVHELELEVAKLGVAVRNLAAELGRLRTARWQGALAFVAALLPVYLFIAAWFMGGPNG